MPFIISSSNEKGGIGKTTTAINFAREVNERGYKVLLVDLDSQGNASDTLGFIPDGKPTITELISFSIAGMDGYCNYDEIIRTNEQGIDYIPSNKYLDGIDDNIKRYADTKSELEDKKVLKKIFSNPVFDKYDFIVLDNRTLMSSLLADALNTSDYVIIPLEPTTYGWDGIINFRERIDGIIHTSNPNLKVLGILINNKPCRSIKSEEIIEAIRITFGDEVFNTVISSSVRAEDSASSDELNKSLYKSSAFKRGFSNFTDEALKRINRDNSSFVLK